jgi:hypothetical protein
VNGALPGRRSRWAQISRRPDIDNLTVFLTTTRGNVTQSGKLKTTMIWDARPDHGTVSLADTTSPTARRHQRAGHPDRCLDFRRNGAEYCPPVQDRTGGTGPLSHPGTRSTSPPPPTGRSLLRAGHGHVGNTPRGELGSDSITLRHAPDVGLTLTWRTRRRNATPHEW